VPLKIGIAADLAPTLPEDVSRRVLSRALGFYTQRPAYSQVLQEPGAVRVDLTGAVTEPVAAGHQTFAREYRPRQDQSRTESTTPAPVRPQTPVSRTARPPR
jgi:sRNA-binding protein